LKGAGTILVRNSDFLADIPLSQALASHLRSGCPATIVLAPHRAGFTAVTIDDRHRVVAFGGHAGGYLFTGYHLIEESVLDLIPRGAPSDIVRDVYFGLAAEGRLNAHVHDGFWWEFGSPREYLEGSIQLVGLPSEKRLGLGDFDTVRPVGGAIASVGAGADLSAPGIQLAGTLAIGMGVMIGEGTTLEDTVVMPGAWIGPRSNLRRCIVAPGTEIPLEFSASDALLAADVDRDSAPERGIEQVSGLLIRRFSSAPAS
jgi:mannose-1-phosphate guanylyltransferase